MLPVYRSGSENEDEAALEQAAEDADEAGAEMAEDAEEAGDAIEDSYEENTN